ncbi:hypothetical protein L6452_36012 [Arctium lappa]|uniref:Uncharacterized protein n=1 Tax=Arctium lappa TaxID=4217 RepID=A0ACB8Y802_ARCLA|nr:hypothetical protein L6452_36012 [Arctium lappa]
MGKTKLGDDLKTPKSLARLVVQLKSLGHEPPSHPTYVSQLHTGTGTRRLPAWLRSSSWPPDPLSHSLHNFLSRLRPSRSSGDPHVDYASRQISRAFQTPQNLPDLKYFLSSKFN